ncbi:MAG: glycosyltransferase family 4 protein [Bacillota bacterium]|nr:glycosyltransferase family 4 protein [Bacillota bacterium]
MRPVRVGLYNPALFRGYGGAQKYTAAIAGYLMRAFRDLELRVVAEDLPESDPIGVIRDRYGVGLDGVVRFVDPGGPAGNSPFSKAIRHELLRRTSDGCDLFINCFHNVHYFRGAKNVHLVHFPAARRVVASPTLSDNALLRIIGAAMDRRYWSSYDLFLCNSLFSLGWLRRYWGDDPARQRVLYPPVDAVSGCALACDAQKKNLILMCSRFDRRKNLLEGLECFVRNMDRFPGYELIVAGSVSATTDERSYFNEVTLAAEASEGRARAVASPSREELAGLFASAKIFWHCMGLDVDDRADPLNVEHFGISTVEAMSAGAVPIVMDKGGQREIVEEGADGFLWKDPGKLVSDTARLIADPALMDSLSRAAREKSTKFTGAAFDTAIDEIFVDRCLIPMEHHR